MKRTPLFRKVFIGLFVVFSVLGSTISLLSAVQLNRSLEAEFSSKGTAVASSIATSAIELLQDRDASTLQSTIDQFLAIQGIAYVMVIDGENEIVSHTFVPEVPPIIRRAVADRPASRDNSVRVDELNVPELGSFIDVAAPILSGVIGTVHVGMDRALITGTIRREIVLQQVVLVSIFALSVALAYIFVNRTARPLGALTKYVGRLAHDGVEQVPRDLEIERIAERSGDEVGDLTKAFLDMAATIRSQIAQLQRAHEQLSEYNRTLEQRVEQRTAEVEEKNRTLEETLAQLKQAQEQIITQEKLASLGALTAGIAHEIKNPLNFVINFAQLSSELSTELQETLDKMPPGLETDDLREVAGMLQTNVTKISEHGARADSIVRNMLRHSRGQKAERGDVDVNALVHEYVGLAYHGMRGQDQAFNAKLEERYDPAVGVISAVPQDLSRALLNVLTNACYAVREKQREQPTNYSPTLTVTTAARGDAVEIRVRDNGNGIPAHVRERIFTPFFTTKPTGSGTGLGLSMTYDIIVKVHKGTIRFESEAGQFTEFIISVPRRDNTAPVPPARLES